jgi:hypothetical protein
MRRAAGVLKAIQSSLADKVDPAFYAALANDELEAEAMYQRDLARAENPEMRSTEVLQ